MTDGTLGQGGTGRGKVAAMALVVAAAFSVCVCVCVYVCVCRCVGVCSCVRVNAKQRTSNTLANMCHVSPARILLVAIRSHALAHFVGATAPVVLDRAMGGVGLVAGFGLGLATRFWVLV